MRSGIVLHKSDRKPCVIPTADRNTDDSDEMICFYLFLGRTESLLFLLAWENQNLLNELLVKSIVVHKAI